jgi:hypothetical protein
MVRRIFPLVFFALLFSVLLTALSFQLMPAAHAFADANPTLVLNRQQGPLGVTLTLSGKKFPPGQVGLSYIDSQGVPGVFVPPSDTSAQVQNGSFVTTNLVLPGSGPIGDWKIVATDSLGSVWTIHYVVLAAPGQQTAGSPDLTLYPTSGMSGDVITFNGSNWLPKGTVVNLLLQVGGNSIPLLNPLPVSDANGLITGMFRLPPNLNPAQATVVASDATTGALRAQIPILINGASPTPTTSPTTEASPSPQVTPTSVATPAPTPVSTVMPPTTGTGGLPGGFNAAVWGPVLLVVGGVLGVAALMLVLFMIPWAERERNRPRIGQF